MCDFLKKVDLEPEKCGPSRMVFRKRGLNLNNVDLNAFFLEKWT